MAIIMLVMFNIIIINKEKVMMIIKKITYDNDHEHHLATQQAAQ